MPITVLAQAGLNETDAEGRKNGPWKKYYPGGVAVRFEGQFEKDQPYGKFTYYHEEPNTVKAVLTYEAAGAGCHAQYYDTDGNIIAEGKMFSQLKQGVWTYYNAEGNLVSMENYKSGQLFGKKRTFYPDEKVMKETEYRDGAEHGKCVKYTAEGVVLQEMYYKKGILHGPVKYFDENGSIIMEGMYFEGKRAGMWNFYKDGMLVDSVDYMLPQQ